MKTTFKSGKTHWAIGHEVTCKRCASRFVAEDKYDFRDGYDSEYVYMTCPECEQAQKVYKPRPVEPFRTNILPCTTGTTTVKWEDGLKSRDTKEVDWMGNVESQQEYLGK